jgi:hypothetical protein
MPPKKKSTRPKAARRGDEKAEGQQGQGTPDTEMERLKIADDSQADEDAFLEEAIKLAAAEKEALDAAAAQQKEQDKKWQRNMKMIANMDTSQLRTISLFQISYEHILLDALLSTLELS